MPVQRLTHDRGKGSLRGRGENRLPNNPWLSVSMPERWQEAIQSVHNQVD
jgi:acyl-homoserine lactone acylase PvdQ